MSWFWFVGWSVAAMRAGWADGGPRLTKQISEHPPYLGGAENTGVLWGNYSQNAILLRKPRGEGVGLGYGVSCER